MTNRIVKAALLCGSVAIASWSASAHAAGTEAGTSIPNQASVSYSVGGTQQSVDSNIATFVVDKKVNLTVTGGVITQTAIGTTDQVTAFQVTNLTNATQDFPCPSINRACPFQFWVPITSTCRICACSST